MTATNCPLGTDKQFGPRVDTACRSFDFTLLFEDAIFILLPSAFFLMLLPSRWRSLQTASVKSSSYQLAVVKLSLLGILYTLQAAYAAVQAQIPELRTQASLPASIVLVIATASTTWTSFLEDQRSVEPSILLVLYFSATSLLSLARTRSLWTITSSFPGELNAARGLWTTINAFMVLNLIAESAKKTRFLRPTDHKATKERLSSLWARGFSLWLVPFLVKGYGKILEVKDIPEVDESLQGTPAGDRLLQSWRRRNARFPSAKNNLLKAAYGDAYRGMLLWAVIPRLASTAFTFSQPFLITASINYMEDPGQDVNPDFGKGIIGAYVLLYIGIAMANNFYYTQMSRLQTALRAGIVSIIYNQTLSLKAETLKDSAAVTLIGTDAQRIVDQTRMVHELWAAFLEVLIAIYLLERQIGVSCIVPVIISIFAIAASAPLAAGMGKSQTKWIERVQVRLGITSSMIGDLRAVQMLGLSDTLLKVVENLRRIEITASSMFRKHLALMVGVSLAPIMIAPYGTLLVYAIVASVRHDTSLLSAKAFTSLSLVTLMTNPLIMFCQSIPLIPVIIACFDRIEKYCLIGSGPEVEDDSMSTHGDAIELAHNHFENSSSKTLVAFHKATIAKSETATFELHDLDFQLKPGVTVIIGPVGSGKTTLLEAVLGDHDASNGTVDIMFGRSAYCPQIPWVMNATIRENITGIYDFDQKWYDFVTSACGLEEVKIPGWDARLTGSKGVALSGGQKQRLGLARAVYSKLDVLIMDSPFSGLDSKTLATITQKLFAEDGYFKKAGKSVILVTNNYQLLPYADDVVVLEEGTVTAQGSYESVQARMPTVFSKIKSGTSTPTEASQAQDEDPKNNQVLTEIAQVEEATDTKADTLRQKGSWSVYTYYMSAATWPLVIFFFVNVVTSAFTFSFTTIWIQWWVEANIQNPNTRLAYWLGLYGMFTFMSLGSLLAAAWLLFVPMISKTMFNLHSGLLNSTLKAPARYFQTIDTGSITNRFSQDMELIAMDLPLQAVNFSYMAVVVLIKLVFLCIIGKYVAVGAPFILLTIYAIQSFYLRTSRQVRLLDIEAKAPIFTHLLETIDGISCIRAFGWTADFRARQSSILNDSQRPVYALFSVQLWLSLVLSLMTGAFAVVLVAVMTTMRSTFSGPALGVALNYLIGFNDELSQSIREWTQMETSIGAVTRTKMFVEETPLEEKHELGHMVVPEGSWLRQGLIKFDNVTESYSKTGDEILKSVSIQIEAGLKVAVCGSSGSGKTSFVLSMLRMLQHRGGTVSIDGTNIATLSLHDLRSSITVIPQDPFLMPGSVRFNMDPQTVRTDAQIEEALRTVGLWSRISENGGLDMDLSSSDWSIGQKQLFELARALLSKSSILVLDEANSNMDWETEKTMQDIIEKEFAQQTVIAVMHRLRFVEQYDKVLLMKKGKVAEYDSPQKLLQQDSEFKQLFEALQH